MIEPTQSAASTGPGPGDPLEAILTGFRESVSVSSDEWTRTTRILTLHLMVDSYLYTILALSLGRPMKLDAFDRLEEYLGPMQFEPRLRLAEALGLVPPDVAGDARSVNAVRNKLVHFRGHRANKAPEITGDDAFRNLIRRGLNAYAAMVRIVDPLLGTSEGSLAPSEDPDASQSGSETR